jgi:hypothetical protein
LLFALIRLIFRGLHVPILLAHLQSTSPLRWRGVWQGISVVRAVGARFERGVPASQVGVWRRSYRLCYTALYGIYAVWSQDAGQGSSGVRAGARPASAVRKMPWQAAAVLRQRWGGWPAESPRR